MPNIKVSVLALVLALSAAPLPGSMAQAGATDPLFVNTTSDDGHRSTMALVFAKHQLERQHPVTIFLSDHGVLLASTKHTAKYQEQQKILDGLVKAGATVLVCPMCMKAFGVTEADLLPGLKVSSPEVIGTALFKDNTKTLSW